MKEHPGTLVVLAAALLTSGAVGALAGLGAAQSEDCHQTPADGCQYTSLAAAVDAAPPGWTVQVPASGNTQDPTPWSEDIGVSTPGLTICSTPPRESDHEPPLPELRSDDSACEDWSNRTIIDGSGSEEPAINISASNVTVRGITVRRTLETADNPAGVAPMPPTAPRPVLRVNAPDAHLEDSRLKLNRPDCPATGPRPAGDNSCPGPNDCPTTGLLPAGAEEGTCAAPPAGSVAELTAKASRTVIENSTLVGPSTGVDIVSRSGGTLEGITLRSNDLALSLDPAIQLGPGVEGTTVDARYNNWTTVADRDRITNLHGSLPGPESEKIRGVTPPLPAEQTTREALDACEAAWTRIADAGTDNEVSYVPPLDASIDVPEGSGQQGPAPSVDGCTSSTLDFHPQFSFDPPLQTSTEDSAIRVSTTADGDLTVQASLNTATGRNFDDRPAADVSSARLVAREADDDSDGPPATVTFRDPSVDDGTVTFDLTEADFDPVGGANASVDLWIEVPTITGTPDDRRRTVYSFYNQEAQEAHQAGGAGSSGQADLDDAVPTPIDLVGSVATVDLVGPTSIDASEEPLFKATPKDRFGTARDDPIVWDTENRTGSANLDPNGAQRAVLTPQEPGEVRVIASVVDDDGEILVSDDLLVGIGKGPLDEIRIESAGADDLGSLNLTADDELNLTAHGFDVRDNPLGPVEAGWSLEPVEDGQTEDHDVGDFEPTKGESTTLDLTDVGRAKVKADAVGSSGVANASDPFTVDPGELADLRIVGADGQPVVGAQNTTDENLNLTAQGMDADGNVNTSGLPVEWSLESIQDSEPVGTLDPTQGSSTTLEFTDPGRARVFGWSDELGDQNSTGQIEVIPGDLDHLGVEITNEDTGALLHEAGGDTAQVDVTTDDEIRMEAIGFDADDNRRGSVAVSWDVEDDSQSNPCPNEAKTCIFAPDRAPRQWTFTLNRTDTPEASTPEIAVSAGQLHQVRIVGADGQPVSDLSNSTDDELNLAAQGLDEDGNVQKTHLAVDWNLELVEGDQPVGDLTNSSAAKTTLEYTTPGEAKVIATNQSLDQPTDRTGALTVTVGQLDHLNVTDGPDTTPADEPVDVTIVPQDADGNERGDDVTFDLTGSGELDPVDRTTVAFEPNKTGTATITAQASDSDNLTQPVRTTHDIEVTVGALDHIRVEEAAGGEVGPRTTTTDASLDLTARAYDENANLRGPIEANWSLVPADKGQTENHEVGVFAPERAANTTLDLTDIGKARIQAKAAGVPALSGSLNVDAGDLHRVEIVDEAGNTLGNVSTTTDATLNFTAVGLDADDNRIGTVSVDWRLEDRDGDGQAIGKLDPNSSTETKLDLTTPGTGVLVANHSQVPDGRDGRTGKISVDVGALDHLTFTAPLPASIPADEDATFEVVPEDADGNAREDPVTCDVNGSGDCTANGTDAFTFVPNQSGSPSLIIQANATDADRTVERDETIDVTVGALDHLAITQSASTTPADEPINLTVEPRDVKDNARGDPVNFTLDGSGELDAVDRNTTRFVPNQTGTVSITANASDPANRTQSIQTQLDVQVTVGSLANLNFTKAPSPVPAGHTATYEAQPLDAKGNQRTDPVNFTVENGTGAATITDDGVLEPTQAGTVWVVANATDPGNRSAPVEANTSVVITPGPLQETSVIGPSQTVADSAVQLSATALDAFGNVRDDPVTFAILQGTGQVDADGVFTPDKVGEVVVQATAEDQRNGTSAASNITVDVNPGTPTQLSIQPASRTLTAGEEQSFDYGAVARDVNGNEVPIDAGQDVAWSIDTSETSFGENSLTPSTTAGLYQVDAHLVDHPTVEATAGLEIQHGPSDRVDIAPSSTQIVEDGQTDLTGTAVDEFGNPTDATVRWSTSSSLVDVNATTGAVTALTPGQANVTAEVPGEDAIGRAQIQVVEKNVPLDHLEVSPSDVSLEAGESVNLSATPIDEEGEPVTGLEPQFVALDETVAVIQGDDRLLGNGVGETTVVAQVEDLETLVPVNVTVGRPAQIQVRPTTATLDPGQSLDLDAKVTDVRHNLIEDASVEWSLINDTQAQINATGNVTAGDSTGPITVTATSGEVTKRVVLHVTEAKATRDETVNVTTTTTEQTVEDTVQTTHSVGLSETEAGSTVNLTPPDEGTEDQTGNETDPTSDEDDNASESKDLDAFEGANVRIDEDAKDVAIAVETQEGSLSVTPDEIDLPDLNDEVNDRSNGNPPGLFVTVTASEGGRQLDSDKLNDLIGEMDTRFKIPKGFFENRSLEPDGLVLAEYSEGKRVGTVDAELIRQNSANGFYHYRTTLTEFSSFAAVAESEATQTTTLSTGGGGGGGGSVIAVDEPFSADAGQTVPIEADLPDAFAPIQVTPAQDCSECRLTLKTGKLPSTAPLVPEDIRVVERFQAELVDADGHEVPVDDARFQITVDEPIEAADRAVVLHGTTAGWERLVVQAGTDQDGQLTVEAQTSGLSPFLVAVDEGGPGMEALEPTGSVEDPTPTLSADFSDTHEVDPDSFSLSIDGDTVPPETPTLSVDADGFTYTPPSGELSLGLHEAEVTVSDEHGQASTLTWTFTILDAGLVLCDPPTIHDVAPDPGATEQPPVSAHVTVEPGCAVEVVWLVGQADGETLFTALMDRSGRTADGDLLYEIVLEDLPADETLELTVEIHDANHDPATETWTIATGSDIGPAGGEETGAAGSIAGWIAAAAFGLAMLGLLAAIVQTTIVGLREQH